jgi:hypothetical protein
VTTAQSLPSANLIIVCHTMVVLPRCSDVHDPLGTDFHEAHAQEAGKDGFQLTLYGLK